MAMRVQSVQSVDDVGAPEKKANPQFRSSPKSRAFEAPPMIPPPGSIPSEMVAIELRLDRILEKVDACLAELSGKDKVQPVPTLKRQVSSLSGRGQEELPHVPSSSSLRQHMVPFNVMEKAEPREMNDESSVVPLRPNRKAGKVRSLDLRLASQLIDPGDLPQDDLPMHRLLRRGRCERVWEVLEDPHSSRAAWWISQTMKVIVILSVFVTNMQLSQEPITYGQTFAFLETTFDLIFFLEFLCRIFSAPSKKEYIKDAFNWADVASAMGLLLRVSIGLVMEEPTEPARATIQAILLFVLPTVRFLKLLRYFETIRLLIDAFRKSLDALPVLMCTMALMVVLSSTALYLLESRTNIPSIQYSIWLCAVTMTTVGYGDVVPKSFANSMEDEDAAEAKQDQKQKEKHGKAKQKKVWEPPPFKVRPRFCPGDSSVAGLPDRQENELMVIKEIFAGAVEELSVGGQTSDEEKPAQGMRPSTPVKRYRVRLSAGAGGPDPKMGGPTAQLEVSYGRLYPMETPRLKIDKVCSVISELLRQHHDPSNEIPLHERMQRREAEQAKLKEEAARHDRELAKKKAMDEWEKQKQAERHRMERYEEKRRAVARVADGGGTLDFLPEDSELGLQGPRVPGPPPAPQPTEKPQKQVYEKAIERCKSPPLKPFEEDISSRFKGGGRVRAPSESSNEGTLPSFSAGLSSGPFVFVASVKEDPPLEVLEAKAKPKAKSSPKMKPSSPKKSLADSRLEPSGDGSVANSGPSGRYATDFEELRLLGKGGFGTVTKVRHRVDRQLYAIKRMELRGSAVEREKLLQECALLPRLTHMHIVRYYQAWIETEQKEQKETVRPSGVAAKARGVKKRAAVRTVKAAVPAERDDWLSHPGQAWARGASPPPGSTLLLETLYIQMEFCDGTTLREAIVSGELQKDEALIWKLFRQVLDALAYVHSKGLIHRDVKPPNIFLSKAEGGHAKLGDFGLSTELANFSEGYPEVEPSSRGMNRQHQSTGVGTAFYMAPEVRSTHSSSPDIVSTQPYDDRVDMFSMGVVFYEMWRQPFFTAMERAQVLGKMALGLSSPDRIKEAQELLPEAPPEAAKVLASLLATDPGERMTADHLLNRSGLLPSGAFDPQVQRVLQALEDPSSSESVALLQALFNRAEEPAKDIPFFEQLFLQPQTQARMLEAEAEARDALLQLFRDLCRKHGAVYDLCPLLRPVRREVPESGAHSPSAVISKGPTMPPAVRLVDAGNTLVELRANLTEPFVRAVAARYAQREDVEDAELLQAVGQQQVRRYHVSTVYREAPSSEVYAQSQFGHPREVSSAVVQFFWQPPMSGNGKDQDTSDSLGPFGYARAFRRALQRDMAYMQEAELLHTLAELFSVANLSSRVELHLSDTRLLRLLFEAAYQKALREVHTAGTSKSGQKAPQTDADRSASSVGERLRTRVLEALRRQAIASGGDKLASSQSGSSGSSTIPVQDAPRIPSAALERAAAELAGLLAGTSSPEAPKTVAAFLSEVEELYVSWNPAPASPRASSGSPRGKSESAADDLKEVLRSLRALDSVLASQTTWRGVVIDPQMPVNSMYGPGLVFSVLMHLQVASPTMVCVGGRVDHLATEYMRLHAPQGTVDEVAAQLSLPGSESLSAISAELAMDKLAAGLVQLAQVSSSQAANNKRGKSQALALAPWWRQSAACWPTVLLGPAQEERSTGSEPSDSWHVEAIQVAAGLWRSGACCQLWPPFIGIDARVVSEAQKSLAQYGLDGISGPLPPDFIVTMRAEKSEKRESDVKEDDGTKKAQKNDEDVAMAKKETRFFLRAISDQGHEALDRAAKDAGGGRVFEGRSKLVDFFERLARRHAGTAASRFAHTS